MRRAALSGAFRRAPALSAGVLAAIAGAAAARADVIYELAPTVGAGATDNVYGAGEAPVGGQERVGAGFTTGGGVMRLRYRGARSDHGLGLRAIYTQYLVAGAPNMFTGNLAWTSGFNLDARWTLRFGAAATVTRASGNDLGDPATLTLQGAVPGTTYYLSTTANQELTYEPSPLRNYGEAFGVSQVHFLSAATLPGGYVLPTTTVFFFALHGNRVSGRETYSLESDAGDAYTEATPGAMTAGNVLGHTFLIRGLLGWQHEYSPVWTTLLQAGPAVIVRLDGSGVLAPSGAATLNYRRLPWFASITATQTPAPNLFLGGAVMTDQVLARVALPLTKQEFLFIGGYGGYIYARVSDGTDQLRRSFDQFTGGASLVAKFPKLPLTAALTYVVLSQRGSALPNYAVPDVARQSILLTLSGELAWGPGTPPLFGGAL